MRVHTPVPGLADGAAQGVAPMTTPTVATEALSPRPAGTESGAHAHAHADAHAHTRATHADAHTIPALGPSAVRVFRQDSVLNFSCLGAVVDSDEIGVCTDRKPAGAELWTGSASAAQVTVPSAPSPVNKQVSPPKGRRGTLLVEVPKLPSDRSKEDRAIMRRRILSYMFLTNTMLTVDFMALSAFFPIFASYELHASYMLIGVVLSAQCFSEILMLPCVSKAVATYGRPRVLLAGLLCTALSKLLVTPLDRSHYKEHWAVWLFVVSRLMAGMGAACTKVTTGAFVLKVSREPTRDFATQEAFQGAGYAVGPLLGGAAYDFLGLRWMFIVWSLPFLLLAVVFVALFNQEPMLEQGGASRAVPILEGTVGELEQRDTFMRLLRPSVLVVFCVPFAVMTLGSCEQVGYSSFLWEQLHASATETGVIFFLESAVYAFSAPLVYRITKRVGLRWTLLSGLLVQSCLTLAMGPPPFFLASDQARAGYNREAAWAIAFLTHSIRGASYGMLMYGSVPALLGVVCNCQLPKEHDPADVSVSLYNASNTVGELIGPLLGGFLTAVLPHSPLVPCAAEECHTAFPALVMICGFSFLAVFIALFSLGPLPPPPAHHNTTSLLLAAPPHMGGGVHDPMVTSLRLHAQSSPRHMQPHQQHFQQQQQQQQHDHHHHDHHQQRQQQQQREGGGGDDFRLRVDEQRAAELA